VENLGSGMRSRPLPVCECLRESAAIIFFRAPCAVRREPFFINMPHRRVLFKPVFLW
jgi:hypothetical protein